MARIIPSVSFDSSIGQEVSQIPACIVASRWPNLLIEALKSLLVIERSPEPEQEQAGANTPGPTPAVTDDDLDADMRRKVEEFKKSLLVGTFVFLASIILTFFFYRRQRALQNWRLKIPTKPKLLGSSVRIQTKVKAEKSTRSQSTRRPSISRRTMMKRTIIRLP